MINDFVTLYRNVGRPSFKGSSFSFDGKVDRHVFDLINKLADDGSLSVLDKEESDLTVDFSCDIPANADGRFFYDLGDFIDNSPSVSKGSIRGNYYIVDIDYFSEDEIEVENEKVGLLKKCVKFISLLAKLSDKEFHSNSEGLDLVFVSPATIEAPAKTMSINTKISLTDLDLIDFDFEVIDSIVNNEHKGKLHVEERKSLLRLAISDTLSKSSKEVGKFTFLIENWLNVEKKYRHDFDCYVNGFSFEKARKDIAKAELDFANGMNSVLSDMTGKLLSVPLSFAGAIALSKITNSNSFEYWTVFSGVWVVSLVMLIVLYNQMGTRQRISNAFGIVFDQFKDKVENYPAEIKMPLLNAQRGVKRQGNVLKYSIYIFGFFAFLPAFIVTGYFLCLKYFN